MNNLERLTEQARIFAEHLIPTEAVISTAVVVPILALVVGLLVAVLGAKLARPSMTAAFGVAGAVLGGMFGVTLGVPIPIGVLVGAVVAGIGGFVLHRLWVGLATCVLLSAVVACAYGSHSVLPQLATYAKTVPEAVTFDKAQFATPASNTQAIQLNPEFEVWAADFWHDLTARDASLERNLTAAIVAAGVFGLLLGLVAVRFTLVMVTSAVGTALFTSGATALTYQFQPELYEASLSHPHALGLACGTFLVGSLVLQALLTRSEKPHQKSGDKA